MGETTVESCKNNRLENTWELIVGRQNNSPFVCSRARTFLW